MGHQRIAVKMEGGEELLKELKACGVNAKKVVAAAVKAGGEVIASAAVDMAPPTSRKGKRVSVRVTARKPDHVTVSVGPTKRHANLILFETGVAPHEIKPETAEALVFEGDTGLVITGGVSHPGMPARPWLRPAFDTANDEAERVVGETLRQAVEEARIAMEQAEVD